MIKIEAIRKKTATVDLLCIDRVAYFPSVFFLNKDRTRFGGPFYWPFLMQLFMISDVPLTFSAQNDQSTYRITFWYPYHNEKRSSFQMLKSFPDQLPYRFCNKLHGFYSTFIPT